MQNHLGSQLFEKVRVPLHCWYKGRRNVPAIHDVNKNKQQLEKEAELILLQNPPNPEMTLGTSIL